MSLRARAGEDAARGFAGAEAVEHYRETALARDGDVRGAAARLDDALAALQAFPAPLETWKSRRVLGLLRRRVGDEPAARRAFALAAADIQKIAAGVDDATLREGFLASAAVREVMDAAGRA